MKRINLTEGSLIVIGMLLSFLFGVYRESYLYYFFESWGRYFLGLTFATGIVLAAAIALSIAIERGTFAGEEERQWETVAGRTDEERPPIIEEFNFTDPEIEAMWNRSRFFVATGGETPKGFLDEKEEDK